MFSWVRQLLSNRQRYFSGPRQPPSGWEEEKVNIALTANEKVLRSVFADCDDIVFREFVLGEGLPRALLVFAEGLSDRETLEKELLKPFFFFPKNKKEINAAIARLEEHMLAIAQVNKHTKLIDFVTGVLSGEPALFVDGVRHGFLLSLKKWEKRNVEQSDAEKVIRGPQEGFTETLRTNTAMIRRRIRDPKLKVKHLKVGRRSQTDVAVMYIEDLCCPSLRDEVLRRLQAINIDAINGGSYIEQFMEDYPWSPFPQAMATQRPDRIVGHLYEGKVAILVDNTPFPLVVPALFNELFHSPEDYYQRFMVATGVRLVRFLGSMLALLLPSFYIALGAYHPEMVPTDLLIRVATARSEVPFPTIIEALIMEAALELLREAGIRLPSTLGQTIGIVGGLVIGQSAVAAGLVSPTMVVIVAVTALGSYVIPNYDAAIALRLLRFALMLLAAVLGIFGLMMGFMAVIIHLASLEPFGVPYLYPWAPLNIKDLKDSIYRARFTHMKTRPQVTSYLDQIRYREERPGRGDQQRK